MVALPRLIALSPGTFAHAADAGTFLGALARALDAGLPGVLLREPRLSDRDFLALGERVRAACAGAGAWLGVHDRAHLAEALGADALHLGFRSLAPHELRPWLARGIALGLSTHVGDDPRAWSGADYVFHGPLHPTPSKAGRLAPVGLDGLARALAASARPLLALGGVVPADAARVRALGAHGVVARAALLGAPDPAAATRAFLAELA